MDTANDIGLIAISSANVGQTIPGARCGIYYDTSDSTNKGRMFFKTMYKYSGTWYYSGLFVETVIRNYVSKTMLSPLNAVGQNLVICGGNDGSNSNGSLYIAPSTVDTNRTMRIAYQSSDNKVWLDNSNSPSTVAGLVLVGTVVSSSSLDVKHDIKPLQDVGSIIDSLQPVSFVYDNDVEEKKNYGLIYEYTTDVLPEICVENQTENSTSKAIDYVMLVPILLKEIQSLRARVRALEG
jgi:hypothetical protein